MLMPRHYALAAIALAAACASSNNQSPAPDNAPPNQRNGQRGMIGRDSAHSNRVIENARPDAPSRAGLIVVANQQAASASVVDAASMKTVATIPVGVGPHEVTISPDGRWAVVSIYGDRATTGNTLAVIDLASGTPKLARTINLGEYHRPHGAAFVQDGQKLVVTSETSQKLLIVDFASGKVDTALATNARGSHMVAVRRDGKKAWTANIADSNVTEFDLAARKTVRQLPAAANDEGIATTPGGILLWVGSNTNKTVTIIDTERGQTVGTLTGFGSTYRIGISRTGRVAVVNDPESNKIYLYEVGANHLYATIDLAKVEGVVPVSGGTAGDKGAGPEGVTFDPIADIAYVTLNGSNQIVAIDLVSGKAVGVGAVGAGPDGIAFSPHVMRRQEP